MNAYRCFATCASLFFFFLMEPACRDTLFEDCQQPNVHCLQPTSIIAAIKTARAQLDRIISVDDVRQRGWGNTPRLAAWLARRVRHDYDREQHEYKTRTNTQVEKMQTPPHRHKPPRQEKGVHKIQVSTQNRGMHKLQSKVTREGSSAHRRGGHSRR